MKIASSSERLKELLRIYNDTQADMVRKTGIEKSAISNYINGRREARQDKLILIGNAYNVSVAWLMGLDVPMDAGFEKRIKAYAEKLENVEHVTDDEVDNLTVRAFRMAQKFDKADDKMKNMIEKALSVPSDYDVTIVEDNGNEIVFTISMGE